MIKRKRDKGRQSTSRLTVNGRVRLRRRWWHSPQDGSECPADALLSAEGGVTRGVRELACRTNRDCSSFDAAAADLGRTAQLAMSGEQLRQIVEAEGRRVLAAQESGELKPAFQAEDCAVAATGKTRMYVGIDGVMVPTITDAEKQARRKKVLEKRRRRGRKCRPLPPRTKGTDKGWKEFKTVTFSNQDQSCRHVVLSRRRRTEVGRVVRREAQGVGIGRADERIANVDGATWIRHLLDGLQHVMSLDAIGLDFYHLSENVHKDRRVVFGEEDAAGKAWMTALMHTFKHDGYETAWETLCAWRQTLKSPRKRKAADRLLNYVVERRDMVSYPEFARKGWDIGSGPTESRCKMATSRLKRAGQRWNPGNAEATAAFTTLEHSGQWQRHWKLPVPERT
ncbi:MAG: hypothetical protein IT428_16445 [Planctomycetaceae bacterium]|nr:hypothetical protein [Planctomycetaceae bacterium]